MFEKIGIDLLFIFPLLYFALKNQSQKMNNQAIVLTAGILDTPNAKTAHGLIRDSERFRVVAVVDEKFPGKDAGELLDGKHRGIPVTATLEAALELFPETTYCIVGVATVGGVFPESMLGVLKNAIRRGLHIVNGLHEHLNDRPDFAALAREYGVELIDIRRPKKRADLHFWTGEIFDVKAPVIAVMGMDCAMGKRTTTRLVMHACKKAGIDAQMVYTGQTGWLQGGKYGFIFDSTLNDFISGELEHAVVTCWKETGAGVILLEGQSGLRNPSGPCGAEYLLSANAKYVILLHSPKRKYFEDEPHWGEIPSVESEMELVRQYGSVVIALALHTERCSREEAFVFQKEYEKRLGIPVLLPLEEGVEKVVPIIQGMINH
jgi:uncharacterized NAD-dependent epimerase/dehydratase family protein